MKHILSLIVTLSLIWLLNSGHYNLLILSLGAFSVLLVVAIAHHMDLVDHESQPLHFTRRLPLYWAWLFKELLLSNIDVAKRIWLGKKAIYPVVKTLKLTQQTDMGRVIYANSITLTPGTVTVDLQDDCITIHAISREGMHSLEEGEMDRRVTELEQ